MSAFEGKADMTFCGANVAYDPKRTLDTPRPVLCRCDASARGALAHTQRRWFSAAKLQPSKVYCTAATVLTTQQHHLPCETHYYTFSLDIRLDAAGSVAEQSKRKCHPRR